MIVVIVLLAAVVAVLAFDRFRASSAGLLADRRRKQVLITLKSGEAFSGVLFAVDRDAVVLREAVAVAYGAKAENVTVDGEAVLLRSDVAYLQVLNP